jgi:hypothetical protein
LCITANFGRQCPSWVIRVGLRLGRSPIHVRCTPDSDRKFKALLFVAMAPCTVHVVGILPRPAVELICKPFMNQTAADATLQMGENLGPDGGAAGNKNGHVEYFSRRCVEIVRLEKESSPFPFLLERRAGTLRNCVELLKRPAEYSGDLPQARNDRTA